MPLRLVPRQLRLVLRQLRLVLRQLRVLAHPPHRFLWRPRLMPSSPVSKPALARFVSCTRAGLLNCVGPTNKAPTLSRAMRIFAGVLDAAWQQALVNLAIVTRGSVPMERAGGDLN